MRTLYMAMMGCDTHGTIDGIPTDVPSFRVRLIFRSKDGRILYGDLNDWRVYDAKRKLARLRIGTDLEYLSTHKQTCEYGIVVDVPGCYRYLVGSDTNGKEYGEDLGYDTKGILEFVNGLLAAGEEPYGTIEFINGWEEWEKIPDVAALLKEFRDKEEFLNATLRQQMDGVDRRKKEDEIRFKEYLAQKRAAKKSA